MLYMVIERFKEPGAIAVYRRARDRGRLLPAGLEYVSSWVDLDYSSCFQLMETDDPGLKLAVFSTGPAIRNTVANLITEIIGTAMLVFGVFALFIATPFTGGAVPLYFAIFGVALLVFAIGMSLGGPTGYAINPARDLGPRIMHFVLPIAGKGDSDWGYAWVPVVGPVIGGILGAWLGRAVFL